MKISRTPLRFSLIGGGSDLPAYYEHYGPCKIISMALSASMYVTLTERNLYKGSPCKIYGNNIRIAYTKTEHVDSIDDIEHELIRESLKAVSPDVCPAAFEMTTIGDIPSRGAGLGSSSALVVGVLNVVTHTDPETPMGPLVDFTGSPLEEIRPKELYESAFHVEHDVLGNNIGCQDHLSAAYGGLRLYRVDSSGLSYGNIMNESGYWLAEHLLAFRLPRNRHEKASGASEHSTLVDMNREMENRAQYLTETVCMVPECQEALYLRDAEAVAKILRVAWGLKKASHGYVDKDIERWYSLGIHFGALAGKVSGSMSAGTGHLFFLAYPDEHDRIREELGAELSEMKADYYPFGSKVRRVIF